MSNELQKIKEFSEKYSTGNYICVVENRFGPKGYFIKEDGAEFKLNWNYTLIHKKHKEVLVAYLIDLKSSIFIIVEDSLYKVDDFIATYDERYSYSSKYYA